VQARQRELELVVERERVSLLERLISDLSHDLKTPVSILYTSTYLLDKLTDRLLRQLLDASAKPLSLELLKDAQQTALSIRNRSDTLKANSERLQKLVDALFDLALLDSRAPFAFETHDLHPILQNLAESHKPVAEDHGLSFSFQAQDLPPLSIDASQVQRSVIKLLENAIQFTPSGGKVALRASSTPDAVLIEVSDTGIGMTPGEQARIFERFYRADPARQMETGGLGLGLNIVQKIVEAHRGSISVESAPEEGSRFIIRLPRTEQR
jgi:signal transduction histidine kinase